MGTYIDVVDTAILCGLDIKQNTLDKAEVQARCPYCNDYKYRMYLSRNPDNPHFSAITADTAAMPLFYLQTLIRCFNP